MRTNSTAIFISLLSMIMVTSCGKSDAAKEADNTMAKIKQQNEEMIKNLNDIAKAYTENGGQPGTVTLTGVIVKEDSQLDSRIKLTLTTGISKDGTQPTLDEKNKVVLNQVSAENIVISSQQKQLVVVGCSEEESQKLAEEKKLEIRKVTTDVPDSMLSVRGQVVAMCGEINKTEQIFLVIEADEIILSNVTLSKVADMGFIILSANKLVLKGTNLIETKALASATMISGAPNVELNISKQIEAADEKSTLEIKSTGADYREANQR